MLCFVGCRLCNFKLYSNDKFSLFHHLLPNNNNHHHQHHNERKKTFFSCQDQQFAFGCGFIYFSLSLKGALKSKISTEKQEKANRGRGGMNKRTETVNTEQTLTERASSGKEEYSILFIQQNLPCFYWKFWSITGAQCTLESFSRNGKNLFTSPKLRFLCKKEISTQ